MIKVFVRNSSIQNADGHVITSSRSTVRAAKTGKVTKGLIEALREMGDGPADGEEVYIEVKG